MAGILIFNTQNLFLLSTEKRKYFKNMKKHPTLSA